MDLDEPVPVQVWNFVTGALQGDLGNDFVSGLPVTTLLREALPHTMILAVSSLGLAVLVGVPLGVYAATRPNSWVDRTSRVVSVSLITLPAFVGGLFLLLLFAIRLDWLPAIGAGDLSDPVDYARHLILPTLALAATWIGYLARLVRTSMLEVLGPNYIRTSRAVGLRDRLIFYKYALKNAIIPTVAVLGVGLGSLMGGAVFVEVIFTRPGLGTLIVDSIESRNFPIVRGAILADRRLVRVREPPGRPVLPVPRPAHPRSRDGERMAVEASPVPQASRVRGRTRRPGPGTARGGAPPGRALRAHRRGRPARDRRLRAAARALRRRRTRTSRTACRARRADHWLGTDELGRDLLSRLIYGTRIALGVAIPAVFGALVVGLIAGTIAGYFGGWIDNALVVVMDAVQAFPAVILALAILAVLGPSLRNVIIVIGVAFAPGYARVARALVLVEQAEPVRRGRARARRRYRAHRRRPHPPEHRRAALHPAGHGHPGAITVEAGLSFLGVGVQPPTPSWGVILADGFDRVRDTPWPVIGAGAVPDDRDARLHDARRDAARRRRPAALRRSSLAPRMTRLNRRLPPHRSCQSTDSRSSTTPARGRSWRSATSASRCGPARSWASSASRAAASRRCRQRSCGCCPRTAR